VEDRARSENVLISGRSVVERGPSAQILAEARDALLRAGGLPGPSFGELARVPSGAKRFFVLNLSIEDSIATSKGRSPRGLGHFGGENPDAGFPRATAVTANDDYLVALLGLFLLTLLVFRRTRT